MSKASVAAIGIAGFSMIAVATWAAIPGGGRIKPLDLRAPDDGAPSARPFTIASAQYGPATPIIAPIPLAEAGAPVVGQEDAAQNSATTPMAAAEPRPPGRSLPYSAGGAGVVEVAGVGGDVSCTLDVFGRRQALPLQKLVAVMRSGIDALGPNAPLDSVRTFVQADLNRSGDGPEVKKAAVEDLKGAYAGSRRLTEALSQPFDLTDDSVVNAVGYDPCGNPTAVAGGSAFGSGPFANDFATINPVPVIASRLATVGEGGST